MNNEIKTISPFRNFCITIGALPTSYLESMSYYEMLCWLCKYLENTINPAINQNAEALKELQSYVANYFDNLDVTEEINNKLDEMADDGTLAEVINVQMIGDLNNLTTSDKTSIVNAINSINNFLNINSFTTYSTFTTIQGTGHAEGNITVARNSDGSLCKVYGYLTFSDFVSGTTAKVKLATDTGLRPSSAITINNSGMGIVNDYNSIIDSSISIGADGTIDFSTYYVAPITQKYIPFLIIAKDFGDQ